MMKKVSVLLSSLLLVLAACAPGMAAGAARLNVAVGVAPMQFVAQRIGGGLVSTVVLVPAGADAHTYEPKPSQMRSLSACSVYLSTGLEFEEAWEPRLKGANKKLVFVHTDEGLKKMPMPEGHEDHGHKAAGHKEDHHDGESDPHVWVSPRNMRHMAARAAEAFAKADPANAKVYAANLAALQKDIDALDAELAAQFSAVPKDRRAFMVFHPAWGYFARDYGLTQTAIEFEGKEPSPKRLGAIVKQAKALGVRAVFVQPQMSQRTAGTIAQAVGAKLVVADPLAEDWLGNLRKVAMDFKQALQ